MNALNEAELLAQNIINDLDLSASLIKIPLREESEALFKEWTDEVRHIIHAYAVAAACEGYARVFGENPELFYQVGLLHDFDNQRYPYQGFATLQEHPFTGIQALKKLGLPDIAVHAILAHASILGIPFTTNLSRVLFAVDELSGFLIALKAVRPDKTLKGIEWKSIHKKLRDERFAAGCDRKNIYKGAELLGFGAEEDFKSHILRVAKFIDTKIGKIQSQINSE